MTIKMQADRIEGKLVVLLDDDENIYNIPKDFFGEELKDGNIYEIEFEDGKPVRYVFLEEETERVRRRIKELMEKLRRKK